MENPAPTDIVPTAVHRGREANLPYVFVDERVELKVLQVKIQEGLWIIQNRFHAGAKVQTHKHTGTVFAFTTSGSWKYAEYDDINTAGSYLYEPAGSVHTLVVPETNTEPTEVWFAITGANLNLDASGNVEQVIDAGLVLQFYRALCAAAGHGEPDVIVG